MMPGAPRPNSSVTDGMVSKTARHSCGALLSGAEVVCIVEGKMAHEERFIPPRQKLDQLSVVKDYAAVPRLEYR